MVLNSLWIIVALVQNLLSLSQPIITNMQFIPVFGASFLFQMFQKGWLYFEKHPIDQRVIFKLENDTSKFSLSGESFRGES